MKKIIIAILVLLLGADCLVGCSKNGDELVIYSGKQDMSGPEAAGYEDQKVALVDEAVDESAEETYETESVKEQSLYVYVCGQVSVSGVYELHPGDRIYQAIELAGGMLPQADEQALNLAAPVQDGQKIYVPMEGEAVLEPTGNGMENATPGKVNINTATQEELCTLAGIGPSKAKTIIAYRDEHGPFKKVEDIMKVTGIKDAGYAKIKDDICVN